MNVNLTGKTALVTGASSGFGSHFGRILAHSGAAVILAARRADRLKALAAEITEAGGKASAVQLDVSDADAVSAAFERLGAVDIVVNNAGVAGETGRAIETTPEEWRSVFDVNVNAAFYVSRAAALKLIDAKKGGSIINIASITGFRPGPGAPAYSASKAAMIQMTKFTAMEWARYGIRVNALAPGYVVTDLNREFLASDFGQGMLKRVPQRRWGEMEDLEGPLLLLASDASAYMTGSVITVDGGHTVSTL